MQNNTNIRGEPIQSVYSDYKLGRYIVNRRYQRKLVWTLDDKIKFIDSLLNQFPVPLFLGVSVKTGAASKSFEILDGMQRLEAITSFIEGRFSVAGKFFDLSVIAETNKQLEEGILTQKHPILEYEACRAFLNYPLPLSISEYTSTTAVDETFRRINTGGIRLSRHEVRQAGCISDFANLIRKISIYIRGDVTATEIINLDKIRIISLTNEKLDYGIKISKTFWAKTHILTTDNILASRDEEVIAHIVAYILDKKRSQTSSSFLDEIYSDVNLAEHFNDLVAKKDADLLYRQVCFVYDELVKIVNDFTNYFSAHIYKSTPFKVQHAFQVIFISLFELLLEENKKVTNYRKLASSLKEIASNHMGILSQDKKWTNKERARLVLSIKGIMSKNFSPREGVDPTIQSWVDNLENILTQSRTEGVGYDFKAGLHSFDGNTQFNNKTLSKIVKTLTAMANSHAGDNYIILGVADNKTAADNHKNAYHKEPKQYAGYYITGINDEAEKHHTNLDKYLLKIHQTLEKEPISEETKRLIQRNVLPFTYYDKEIILFKIRRESKPIEYNGEVYIRKMSNVDPTPIPKDKIYEFYTEFMEQSKRYPYN
ncbi:DUF262 domain-containing protein [Enterobacter roggenkampii]|uniref:GmrSD restriction endonuclease domain-containing protein n=1 Tax=Enterobacter roggenkampii TaxID=1812935 RepID=UPI0032AEE075